ncbi:hypothetical protein EJ04DRAFT_568904 [Polyplosphaeria fusca]|uniref:Uncharacterized protein n=1 Tax=Polyplosphaeria fusca TaxID=682080 RepID=A0A9P4UUQ9_9PLEO|nr:hypothetical protein EJ04DRAFT_568904 [Polyplosphaeria fusca]
MSEPADFLYRFRLHEDPAPVEIYEGDVEAERSKSRKRPVWEKWASEAARQISLTTKVPVTKKDASLSAPAIELARGQKRSAIVLDQDNEDDWITESDNSCCSDDGEAGYNSSNSNNSNNRDATNIYRVAPTQKYFLSRSISKAPIQINSSTSSSQTTSEEDIMAPRTRNAARMEAAATAANPALAAAPAPAPAPPPVPAPAKVAKPRKPAKEANAAPAPPTAKKGRRARKTKSRRAAAAAASKDSIRSFKKAPRLQGATEEEIEADFEEMRRLREEVAAAANGGSAE